MDMRAANLSERPINSRAYLRSQAVREEPKSIAVGMARSVGQCGQKRAARTKFAEGGNRAVRALAWRFPAAARLMASIRAGGMSFAPP
jgi:hypothetical protein